MRFGPADDFYDVGTFRESRWVGSIACRFKVRRCQERGRLHFSDGYGNRYDFAFGDPAAEIGLRTFVYGSFLLTYDPWYAMLQEAFKTASGFPIMPETGLVALNLILVQ